LKAAKEKTIVESSKCIGNGLLIKEDGDGSPPCLEILNAMYSCSTFTRSVEYMIIEISCVKAIFEAFVMQTHTITHYLL
jgi:hypothetical protein